MYKNKSQINFESVVKTHQEKVRNTCFRFVKNQDDAEDIAQEVFIQIYNSFSDFRQESQLSTWIYRIAVNKSLDYIRKMQRKKRFAQLISIFKNTDEEFNEIELPSQANPQFELEEKERKIILDNAIAGLPESQKSAIILSRYENFSNEEIAQILNTSVSAVEALLNRGKKNLRKLLKNYYEKIF